MPQLSKTHEPQHKSRPHRLSERSPLLSMGTTSTVGVTSSQLTLPILYCLPSATSTSFFVELYYRGAATVVALALFSSLCSGLRVYLQPGKRASFAGAAALSLATLGWTQVASLRH
ncbi:hypothetical protein B0J12DRAFT_31302 [Macrophomina phaseolina]|uniref:Uncharacterized protein n=1 Tax=Macrophomina phaseolina TaxID=35725 RepID=A0ABQ8GVN9_9PEZI|nr:hypothetical protein B0J12DRAFT_31302 [Macrophomina phaseolina]